MKRIIDLIFLALASSLLFVSCQKVSEGSHDIPTVTTDAATEIGMTKAVVLGSIVVRYHYFRDASFLLSTQPDLSDAKEFDAAEEGYVHEYKEYKYKAELTGLTPGTTYYVALSATDGYSVIVGNTVSFRTSSNQ